MENQLDQTAAAKANFASMLDQSGMTADQVIIAAESAPNVDNVPVEVAAPLAPPNARKIWPVPFDPEALTNSFKKELVTLEMAGAGMDNEVKDFEKQRMSSATAGLAKILGVYVRFFRGADADDVVRLQAALQLYCKLKDNKGTSVMHMLSRVFRGNNARQASGDAIVLNAANKVGKDEASFPAWVAEFGGLDKIRKGAADVEKDKKEKRSVLPEKAKTLGQMKTLFKKAEDAVWNVAVSNQVVSIFSFAKDSQPEMYEMLRPSDDKNWKMIIVNEIGDKLVFQALFPYTFPSGNGPSFPVQVDGDSDVTDLVKITDDEGGVAIENAAESKLS